MSLTDHFVDEEIDLDWKAKAARLRANGVWERTFCELLDAVKAEPWAQPALQKLARNDLRGYWQEVDKAWGSHMLRCAELLNSIADRILGEST